MQIGLSGIGKRYSKNWILKDVNLQIQSGEHIAILGKNGSGKSTLLKIISGYLGASKGSVTYSLNGSQISNDRVFNHLGFVAPYQDVYVKMTFEELVDFHFSLREYRTGSSRESVLSALELPARTPLTSFSSGMLQRVKLLLALHTDSMLLIFDEPTMNLDEAGSAWFIEELTKLSKDLTVIIASNIPGLETATCSRTFSIDSNLVEPFN